MLYFLIKLLATPLGYLLLWPDVQGREHLSVKGKAIFVSNHTSMLDPFLIALVSRRHIHFMAKAELFRSWLLRRLLHGLLAFPVQRHQGDRTSIRNALRVLDKGNVFGIFPEGKRSVTRRLDAFERGAAFLAVRAKAPVVPIYLSPDSYRWGKRVRVFVGAPIDAEAIASASKKSAAVDAVANAIEQAVQRLAEDCRLQGLKKDV